MLSRVEVMIVDDEYPLRAALRRALALEGYGVTDAASGEEAIELLKERSWDAMVLDVLMPGISGVEVCERLRAAGERIPILMLTARETVADRVVGLEAGADDYLVKPFALEELLARLTSAPRPTRWAFTSATCVADEARECLDEQGVDLSESGEGGGPPKAARRPTLRSSANRSTTTSPACGGGADSRPSRAS